MKNIYTTLLILCLITIHLFALTPDAINTTKANDMLKKSSLLFIENKGQITETKGNPRPDVLYTAEGNGVKLFITKTGIYYQFSKIENPESLKSLTGKFKAPDEKREEKTTTLYRLEMHLQGANENAEIIAESENPYYENYYNIPSHPEGITNVRSYEKIRVKNIYPNIDWVLYTKDGKMEYDFVVNPGGNVDDIKIRYDGANNITQNDDGSIVVTTPFGSVTENAPYSYQTINNTTKQIKSRFVKIDEYTLAFKTEPLFADKSLIIDPGLLWATYYGGNLETGAYSVALDNKSNIYLGGITGSTNNIAFGGFQNIFGGGGNDAFLVKFDSSGNRLWATYYGGSGDESNTDVDLNPPSGVSVGVDYNGNVYMGGKTSSTANISSSGFQNIFGGGTWDAFLVKFNSSGIRLWGTYYGGSGDDFGNSIAVDKNANVYLAGYTNSTSGISSGGYQNTLGGSNDAFIVKFDSSGNRLWATYYGGSSDDYGNSIALDSEVNIYLAGSTGSTTGIAYNGFQNTPGGGFLVKFNSLGNRIWGTYYNGSGYSVAIDNNENVFLAGYTTSYSGIAYNGFQNLFGGGEEVDAFLVKFDSTCNRTWGTYYCGNNYGDFDYGYSVATDNNGNVYLAGSANSPDGIAANGFQNTSGGVGDAFLVKFDSTGSRLWGTYYGGSQNDGGLSVTFSNNNIYLAGFTYSANGIASGGFQDTLAGNPGQNANAFLAKFNGNCYPNFNVVNIIDTVCQGRVYQIGSYSFNQSGSYSVVLNSASNCDSVVNLNLFVKAAPSPTNIFQTICLGQSYQVGNHSYTQNGNYKDTLLTNSGCDSIVHLFLTVTIPPTSSLSYNICPGDSFQFGGNFYKNVGTYYDTVQTNAGCDSVLVLNLSLRTAPPVSINPTFLCNSEGIIRIINPNATFNYIWNTGQSGSKIPITLAGTYTVTATDTNGCANTASVTINNYSNCGGFLELAPDSSINYFDTLHVKVKIWAGVGIFSTYAHLHFDSTLLQVAGNSMGNYLGNNVIFSQPVVTGGSIDFGMTRQNGQPGSYGDGVIYDFAFIIPILPSAVVFNATTPNFITTLFRLSNITVYDTTGVQPSSFNALSIDSSKTIIRYYVPVWPGDLNNDHIVNVSDILPIGYFYNATGTARPNGSLAWIAQPAPLWGFNKTTTNGSAYKTFADGNADGVISLADQAAIGFNLGKSHARLAHIPYSEPHFQQVTGIPAVNVLIPDTFINHNSLPMNEVVTISIGSPADKINNLFGVSFDLFFNPAYVNTGAITTDYSGSIFGVLNTDFTKIEDNSVVANGTFSIGMTRYNNNTVVGSGGTLVKITFPIPANAPDGWFSIISSPLSCNDSTGTPITITGSADSLRIGLILGMQEVSSAEEYIRVYPNPTNGNIVIEINADNNSMSDVKISNMLGQVIYNSHVSLQKGINTLSVDLGKMDTGVYIVDVNTAKTSMKQKLIRE